MQMAMREGASAVQKQAAKTDAREQALIRRIENGEEERFD